MEDIIERLLNIEDEIQRDTELTLTELEEVREQRLRTIEERKEKILNEAEDKKRKLLSEAMQKAEEIKAAIEKQKIAELEKYESTYREVHERIVEKYFRKITEN